MRRPCCCSHCRCRHCSRCSPSAAVTGCHSPPLPTFTHPRSPPPALHLLLLSFSCSCSPSLTAACSHSLHSCGLACSCLRSRLCSFMCTGLPSLALAIARVGWPVLSFGLVCIHVGWLAFIGARDRSCALAGPHGARVRSCALACHRLRSCALLCAGLPSFVFLLVRVRPPPVCTRVGWLAFVGARNRLCELAGPHSYPFAGGLTAV